MTPQFYWHMHHLNLVEPRAFPIEERITYIKSNKPADEIEARLRLLKPVQSQLPVDVVKEGEVCVESTIVFIESWKAYCKVAKTVTRNRKGKIKGRKKREAFDFAIRAYWKEEKAQTKVWKAYDNVVLDNLEEIEALHAEECPDCPWDGETIFPEEAPEKKGA